MHAEQQQCRDLLRRFTDPKPGSLLIMTAPVKKEGDASATSYVEQSDSNYVGTERPARVTSISI